MCHFIINNIKYFLQGSLAQYYLQNDTGKPSLYKVVLIS